MMITSTDSSARPTTPDTATAHPTTTRTTLTPWLTVSEAADRARCGKKLIYREVAAGRLQARMIGGRRALRFLAEWVDAWLLAGTRIQ
jgi:excisionase family DNA binding protein